VSTERFIADLIAHTARLAVGTSAARGKGNAGAVPAARQFFVAIELRRLAGCDSRTFRGFLDDQTALLLDALPSGARKWGLARKLVNIYLRDATYSRHLCEHFRGLSSIEPLLELPLDYYTARGLLSENSGLPKWVAVKALRPEQSDAYQEVAAQIAASRGIARVHLDAAWWGNRDDKSAAS
jgi:hypothetical protein